MEKHKKEKSKSPELPKKSKKKPKRKIEGRTPERIKDEIRWLEYRRAKEFPKLRKDAHFHNLRVVQANDIITKALKALYKELEVAERLGLKGHGKKKKN